MSQSFSETNHDEGYHLIDFGEGRKLESFAGWEVDRPSPAAETAPRAAPGRWRNADSRFELRGRRWSHRSPAPDSLSVDCGGFRMPVSPTPFGHVGLFPEQFPNWRWLRKTSPKTVDSATDGSQDLGEVDRPRGLNLFAYTGASSMAMASSGMAVAHVDAAKPNVGAAREAAVLNGLAEHPIRYLVDDAIKFAARESRRGRRYHTIVMDPPAYGHAPGGKAWRLERDLWPLIDVCLTLLDPNSFRILITGHSPQIGGGDVLDYLAEHLVQNLGIRRPDLDPAFESGRLSLPDARGRRLDAGFYVRLNHTSNPTDG